MGEDLNTYGGRLKAARLAARLTQTQLAKAAKIDQSTISELENPKKDKEPAKGSAYTAQFAHATGVQALWLAVNEGPRKAAAKTGSGDVEGFVDTLNEVEKLFREEGKRLVPGSLARVSQIVYRIEVAEGRRPSRAVILELIRSAA